MPPFQATDNDKVLKLADSKFKNHTGGVIQVTHTARWGSVPEALLEDKRLDLDSRAVAAWLAIKPAGWQINVDVLRRRLASDNKKIWEKIDGKELQLNWRHVDIWYVKKLTVPEENGSGISPSMPYLRLMMFSP